MADRPRIEIEFAGLEEMRREFEQNFQHGRASLSPAPEDLAVFSDCDVVLVRPDGVECAVPAQVVARYAVAGTDTIGFEFSGFGADAIARLKEFVFADGTEPGIGREGDAAPRERRRPGQTLQEQLRGLSTEQQAKRARNGSLEERVCLERTYGKTVWEALLKNPGITVPEVARIAKKGTVPRVLLDIIIDNSSWVKTPPVRRALLENSHLSADQLQKVMRHAPKSELKQIEKSGAFPSAAREVAKRLLRS
jgi:hypothetical protein